MNQLKNVLSKEIIIKKENFEKITKELEVVQAKAKVRTMDAEDVLKAAERITDQLYISKRSMEGIKAEVDLHAQTFPNAYGYAPYSTQVTMVYKKGSWRLVEAKRDYTKGNGHKVDLTLTPSAECAIIRRVSRFNIL